MENGGVGRLWTHMNECNSEPPSELWMCLNFSKDTVQMVRLVPQERVQWTVPTFTSYGGGRSGYSGALQNRSSTLCLWSQCSMCLCRKGRTAGGHSCTSRIPSSRAPDRVSTPRCSHSPSCTADGGVASGSAYDRVSCRCNQAACRAAR